MTKQELARQMFSNGLVERADEDTFYVGEKRYKVTRENNEKFFYDFYCRCPAWKFDSEHDCKHCIAVALFEANETPSNGRSVSTEETPKESKNEDLPSEDDEIED